MRTRSATPCDTCSPTKHVDRRWAQRRPPTQHGDSRSQPWQPPTSTGTARSPSVLKPCLIGARRVWRKLGTDGEIFTPLQLTATGQEASDLIKKRLQSGAPAMIGRFGSTELTCIRNYLGVRGRSSVLQRSLSYITGRGGSLWWEEESLDNMVAASGFFPASFELLERFCVRMLDDTQLVDILGSWMSWEKLVEREL